VLSTSRFAANMPDYYEPEILATRRVMLQALSTTGSMLGLTRPTDPLCPLAYPSSFDEFQQKRMKLCRSEEEQRDRLLLRRGGQAARFGRSRSDEVALVYRKYFIE
jgi:predicted Zn-dependent protease